MEDAASRPFYDEYAWAYDLLITPPLSRQCDFLLERFSDRGVLPAMRLLDAGCGAGKYAIELARRGYRVDGIDASAPLIAEAEKRSTGLGLQVTFTVANILDSGASTECDGILCRGVLNDLLTRAQRLQVFLAFARALRPDGALIFDVRDWESTATRKTLEPVFEKTVDTERGKLTFRSVTRLDKRARQLLVSERHTLINGGSVNESSYDFRMQCWTESELKAFLTEAGFERLELLGAYDADVPIGTTDRIVCVSCRTQG